ncbi:MAG: hypothetical protein SCM11_01285, partial [Bacillota bacterium]|nr:hypothetical protein [Bacillota bacterium]
LNFLLFHMLQGIIFRKLRKISVITTTRAYSDLEEEGFIASVQGKGCYVLPRNKEMVRENALRKIELGLNDAIAAARASGIGKDEVLEILNVLYEEDDYAEYSGSERLK